jgi:putative transposase
MARPPRIILPGIPVHITQRGNDRVRTFHSDDDYAHYRNILAETARDSGCAIHAWVLMPNHVHLLLTPVDVTSASLLMKRVGIRYVRHVNARYGRTGTLWEGRFRSSIVSSERYLLACLRYIELNPVRAGIVRQPDAFRWSSHRHHALGHPDAVVTSHSLYTGLGPTAQTRQAAWVELCQEGVEPDVLEDIRKAVRATGARVEAREATEFAHVANRLGDVGARDRLAASVAASRIRP